jgi:hypothetical protein
MFSQAITRRLAVMFLMTATVAACKESTGEDEDEPEVATMRLTVGSQTVTVAENGTVTGGPLRIATANQTLTAQFLKADGTVEGRVSEAEFRLEVTGATGITFTRQSGFVGSIRGAAAGTTTVNFGLLHVEENHVDFGPFPVQVQTQ